jgi:hypothetical protein
MLKCIWHCYYILHNAISYSCIPTPPCVAFVTPPKKEKKRHIFYFSSLEAFNFVFFFLLLWKGGQHGRVIIPLFLHCYTTKASVFCYVFRVKMAAKEKMDI